MSKSDRLLASPKATGGAGTVFEQHVGAYWLVLLLTGGIPPILIDTTVARVCFQTRRLGWHTDDFLVECESGLGLTQKLACHVRSNFRVSASDERFKTAIQDFWRDFNCPTRFAPRADQLVLVTQLGSKNLLEHFGGLLDCARAASSECDFRRRLQAEGYLSKTAGGYWKTIVTIIREVEAEEDETTLCATIWEFLRAVHVLSLDLNTSTRQSESQIKSLLGHSAANGSLAEVARTSWDALLKVASEAAPQAANLARPNLPEHLRRDHGTISAGDQRLLDSLGEHSAPVLRGIRSVLGKDCHLERGPIVGEVLGQLQTSQVVLVSGPAGSGKSAVAKDAAQVLSRDHFVFAFRAEEFAHPHIDAALQAAQIPSQAAPLFAMLGAQERIVILVDSAERILERSTRDAFGDLIALSAGNPAIRIVLTCRDYSTGLVRSGFLNGKSISSAVLGVPPLTDSELDEVVDAHPALAEPLANAQLRDILRNPYFLDKAVELPWSPGQPAPATEREFRNLFWRDVIRADTTAPAGMPARREAAFIEVAIGRARALSTYVSSAGLDPGAIDALKRDSLIVSPNERPGLVTTPHDVLEDWAILRWLDSRLEAAHGALKGMASIGTHPAIRRSYRRWLEELLERDPSTAERLFDDAFTDHGVRAQLRDDTITSLLSAATAPALLASRGPQLLAHGAELLKRVIHLLRVACVGTPSWLSGEGAPATTLSEPVGPSWPVVLRLVHDNMDEFPSTERLSLIGLLEDATRGLSWRAPTLDGAEFVAGIAYRILADLGGYNHEDSRCRVLQVIARIPKADAKRFEKALRGTVEEHGRLDPVAKDFRELILFGMHGMHAARDLPDLVVSVAEDSLLATDREARSSDDWDLRPQFGLRPILGRRAAQASAIQGPWLHLLKHHPAKGVAFLVRVFDHSANTYAETCIGGAAEPTEKIELTFPDGKTRTQWGNQRLWNLYRGTSVGPCVLVSMLMALERHLLDMAEERPDDLDAVLTKLLVSTDSASLTAVVASVATAHPKLAGKTLLALLSAPGYIAFDRGRLVAEAHASFTSGFAASVLSSAEVKIYADERAKANALPHRKGQLETAVLELQLRPFAPRVHAALDDHKRSLPPASAQTESDRIWRLSLHRMDLREHKLSNAEEEVLGDRQPSPKKKRRPLFRLLPKRLDPDLEPIVAQNKAESARVGGLLELLMWGLHVWEGNDDKHDPSNWRAMLTRARTTSDFEGSGLGTENGPGVVAAVCVRDHWEEMTAPERAWCVDRVCSEILRTSNNWNSMQRTQRRSGSADRHGAAAVAGLLRRSLPEAQTALARRAFTSAFTHPVDEVRMCALTAIDEEFWDSQPDIAMRSVNALAAEATAVRQEFTGLARRRRRTEPPPFDEAAAIAGNSVRARFWEAGGIPDDVLPSLHPPDRFAEQAITYTLTVLAGAPNNPVAVAAFADACQYIVNSWDAQHEDAIDFGGTDTQPEVLRLLEKFCMRTSGEHAAHVLGPMLRAVDRHPDQLCWFVQGLTQIEDAQPNTRHYWNLWQLFADRITKAKWIGQLHRTHHSARPLLRAIFLTQFWKEEVRHWRSVEGYADRVDALFEALPPTEW